MSEHQSGKQPQLPPVFATLAAGSHTVAPLAAAAAAARRIADGCPLPTDATAMTHSWLVTGPPGAGRSTAALAFAAALVCDDPTTVGCGSCHACHTARTGSHADVLHIVPAEASISVAKMREVIRQAYAAPTVARWRVIIIEDADRLTDAAANALLKTVEEPPARTIIMLCAPSNDPADIAVTLTSRCRQLYIPTPSVSQVADQLQHNTNLSRAQAETAAAASACHIGRARHLATSANARARRDAVLAIANTFTSGSEAFLQVTKLIRIIEEEADESLKPKETHELEKLKTALGTEATGKGTRAALRGTATELKNLEEQQKKRRKRFHTDAIDMSLTDLAGIIRDGLAQATGAGVAPMNPDKQPIIDKLANNYSPASLIACFDAISECRTMLTMNTGYQVALDAMLAKMRIACRR
ncbi:DNA polymerase III subunit delta' [Corynebacterium choanae]|uniref:DNA polymerase III subunit tau n=1 Tax=Corynebacterium choanae TaxID=1862358 RepID=A0A3G6J8U8_9CORY|nr:DNA polymerase III subunit delta' [Corynebacterium choanae]AZA14541.1 DNA polymerase III subunit tau [Corynebacterium choanae]